MRVVTSRWLVLTLPWRRSRLSSSGLAMMTTVMIAVVMNMITMIVVMVMTIVMFMMMARSVQVEGGDGR